ncbi:MAG: hypothetical protein QXW78_00085 [Candidatus Thermoplasmatota archaeon]
MKKILSMLIFFSFAMLGCLKSEKEAKETDKFEVLSVFFRETENPNEVLLNMKVKWVGKEKGAPRCDIYFPPQEGLEMGIGPIENGPAIVEPLYQEGSEVKEAILKEFIARSFYPNYVAPEFGKSYFGRIKFYWPSLNETYEWEGNIGWIS